MTNEASKIRIITAEEAAVINTRKPGAAWGVRHGKAGWRYYTREAE